MKLSEPRDKAILDETDIEEWTGLELLIFDWDEPFWILRDLPPVMVKNRKCIINLLKKEFAHLEAKNEIMREFCLAAESFANGNIDSEKFIEAVRSSHDAMVRL